MYTRFVSVILAAAAAVVLVGCDPIGEPWDSTGYFEEERSRPEPMQEQLRQRARHTQRGA